MFVMNGSSLFPKVPFEIRLLLLHLSHMTAAVTNVMQCNATLIRESVIKKEVCTDPANSLDKIRVFG